MFWALAVGAFAVLGAAAVWMGGLNQDEGWYLYAANLVAEGKIPYRDFFYTQGPLLPILYSPFTFVWKDWGILGARVFTLTLGAAGIVFAVALARRLVPQERRNATALAVVLLLGSNLYHLYYLTIPKTYALASLFVMVGFYLMSVARDGRPFAATMAGVSLAFGAGTRISLGALLCVVGLGLLFARQWKTLLWFCVGGIAGLALVYLPFLCGPGARAGLVAAQQYHAARGGSDVVWTVGSFSRLVRWYLPVFVILGLVIGKCLVSRATKEDSSLFASTTPHSAPNILLWGFLTVFVIQMLAPFPYEDYQVPIMGLLAVYAAVMLASTAPDGRRMLPMTILTMGLCFANSFGSPLLEKWSTNGQDRFWSLKKDKFELAQLRNVAREIERIDPDGKELLTQDLYLAIETGRKVPTGLEMGPFSVLTDGQWRALLKSAPCALAALSGYSFAVEPPVCGERPLAQQMEYWAILKQRYELVDRVEMFGQNATTLLLLKRK